MTDPLAGVATWAAHPLCAPTDCWPRAFWGPERLDPAAWRELARRISPDAEIAALLAALGDATDAVDVGGGTGLLTRAIAARMPVVVIEPSDEQRAHLPAGITARAGRAEALPLADRACDAAIATWVLQYTDDPTRAVDELARVARRRVAIVQAAPGNDLVDVYNCEATVAGLPAAHHGWLVAHAAAHLEAAGFTITLERVAIDIPGRDPDELADLLSRLHFASHPDRAAMAAATRPLIADRLAARGALADDGVVLTARR
jgi:SAM-dependent methyltransferase